jgi:hypothetical protein
MMRKAFEYGGVIAGAILIAFGIVAIVMGVNGRSEVRDNLAAQKIYATPDAAEITGGKLQPEEFVNTGAEARQFAKIMEFHALESTEGARYAEMGRFLTPEGEETSDEALAAKTPEGRLLGECFCQALERRDEPEVIECFRTKLDREPPYVVQSLYDLLAHGSQRVCARLVVSGLLDSLQTEQHGRQLLSRVIVQLAREAPALEFLRPDDAAQRVARDARRQVDGDRGAAGERLGEPQVLVAEARVASLLVVHDEDADRLTAGDEGHVQA